MVLEVRHSLVAGIGFDVDKWMKLLTEDFIKRVRVSKNRRVSGPPPVAPHKPRSWRCRE
jgi:hypothetical protein